MTSPTLIPADTSTFTALDRCDRCGARAKVQVRLAGGGELMFCAHHGREHWSALARQGADFRGTAG